MGAVLFCGFGLHHGAGGGNAHFARQITLGQQNDVSTGDLILKHLAQGRVMFARRNLRCCQLPREMAGGHGFGIGQRDHAINGDQRTNAGPIKRLQQRLGQSQPRSFDQDMIGPLGQGQQRFDRGNEIFRHGAADATVRQFDDVFHGAIVIGARFQDVAIHPDCAKLIDQHRQALALRVLHQMPDQRGFARAQKACDDRNGNFGKIGH